jgi:hypothetical protein
MRTLRIGIGGALMACAVVALAMPAFVQEFKNTYKIARGSNLDKAGCAVCHIGKSPKLNPYGLDLKKAMAADKTKKLTAAILKKVEGLDSDKDKAKNLAEIKKGTLPGDPKSK